MLHLSALFLVSALAVAGFAAPAPEAPSDCPPFGAAVCRGQRGKDGNPCGQASQHNLAYALRVGHLDYDWMSGLLYNQHMETDANWPAWEYIDAPDPEDLDAWCLEDCRNVRQDPKRKKEPCADNSGGAGPPAMRPPWPRMVRCFGGDDYTGGVDYSKYPLCGAPVGIRTAGVFPVPGFKRKTIRLRASAPISGEELQDCTGGNTKCICVKNDPRFNRYEGAAAAATQQAFGGADLKPEGMSDGDATAKICAAYNARETLGPNSECRSQKDEIVLSDPDRPSDKKRPDVSVDVVTSFGSFWRKAIAACEPGVH